MLPITVKIGNTVRVASTIPTRLAKPPLKEHWNANVLTRSNTSMKTTFAISWVENIVPLKSVVDHHKYNNWNSNYVEISHKS